MTKAVSAALIGNTAGAETAGDAAGAGPSALAKLDRPIDPRKNSKATIAGRKTLRVIARSTKSRRRLPLDTKRRVVASVEDRKKTNRRNDALDGRRDDTES